MNLQENIYSLSESIHVDHKVQLVIYKYYVILHICVIHNYVFNQTLQQNALVTLDLDSTIHLDR